MSRIEVRSLVEIGSQRPGPCVSLFVPAPSLGPEAGQTPVHLSNMIRDVVRRLASAGMREEEARRLVRPVDELSNDPSALQGPGQGLAVFVAPGTFRTVRVEPPVGPSFTIARRFVTRPLLGATRERLTYYVLALSQGTIRLLRSSGPDFEAVAVPGMPAGIGDLLKYQETEAPSLELHSAGHRRQGDVATFHGTTELSAAQKAILGDLLRAVDASVRPVVDGDSAPLVLASVDYLDSAFREISNCRSLIDGRVAGSPDRATSRELVQKARAPVETYRQRQMRAAIDRFIEMSGGSRASRDEAIVLHASHQGRVEDLFIAQDAALWGTFDPSGRAIRRAPAMGSDVDDLLDLAANRTLAAGGNVYPLSIAEMPGAGPARPVAATFRWA